MRLLRVVILSSLVALLCTPVMARETIRERRERLREQVRHRVGQGAGAEYRQIAGLDVAMWEPGRIGAPVPLVLFSHGYHGINTQSARLMRAIADAGYIVVAPNHKDAIVKSRFGKPQIPFGKVMSWTPDTYRDRGHDLLNIVAELRIDPRLKPRIDFDKIALVGHSLGGYTVLAMAGAWPEWRSSEPIKAVVAWSPYVHPFNANGALPNLHIPVMYQTGTMDPAVAAFLKGPKGAFAKTSAPAILVDVHRANHFTWTNLNREQAKEDLIAYYTISFLNKYVKLDASAAPEKQLPGVATLQVKTE